MAGRPSKYTKALLKKAADYLENYRDTGDVIPSIEGLARALNIGRQTIYDWKKDERKVEFAYILEQILSEQARSLLNNGLLGIFNSAIAKLALGKHGYSEKSEQDITSGGKKIENNFIITPVTTKKSSKKDVS